MFNKFGRQIRNKIIIQSGNNTARQTMKICKFNLTTSGPYRSAADSVSHAALTSM